MIAILVILAVGLSGCVTKKYVSRQVKPVDQRVSALDHKMSQQISAVTTKHDADVSRLDERVTTTDGRVTEVASVAQQASASADQANQLGEANRTEMRTHTTHEIVKIEPGTLQLMDKGDVTFKLNKSSLDKQSKAVLDAIAQKAKSTPGTVISLEGFADKSGSNAHNLTLSRNRADAVARYLVQQNVPVHDINRIGLGEQIPSSDLASDFPIPGAKATRRVYIRLYSPTGTAARSEP